jgi:hypothetical protein
LLVLRLRSIAARRASTCWACLLCGPCALPPTPPKAAKCVGIVRLPAAVDMVATCFSPAWPESLDTAVSNTGVPTVESRRSIARHCHQSLPCRCPERHCGRKVWVGWPDMPRRGTIRYMAVVGNRVQISSRKVGEASRDGVVTGVTGSLLQVRWSTGEESTVAPSMGSLAVVGKRSGGSARRRQIPSASAAEVRASR